jgi:hypothetical protein
MGVASSTGKRPQAKDRCSFCKGYHNKQRCDSNGNRNLGKNVSRQRKSARYMDAVDEQSVNRTQVDDRPQPPALDDGYHSENDLPDDDVPENPEIDDEIGEDGPVEAEIDRVGPIIDVQDFEIEETSVIRTRTGAHDRVDNVEKPIFSGDGPLANVPDGLTTPLDYLRLFLDDVDMQTFVDATNAYAASCRKNINSRGWPLLTVNELWTFFGIVLFLGTLKVRYRRTLWDTSSKYYNEWVASSMSCGRFEVVMYCLHWTNTLALTDAEKREQSQIDSFWCVSGFLEHLRTKFQQYYTPGQDVDVDEQGIPSKCYHRAIQYNKDKPHKWFFKVWSLNCSSTSYCYNFKMYKGGDMSPAAICPLTNQAS